MENCGIEIELKHQCMYSYEFCAAGNKAISIGLRTLASMALTGSYLSGVPNALCYQGHPHPLY